MSRAAIARKCARFCQCRCWTSIRRRYASLTRAWPEDCARPVQVTAAHQTGMRRVRAENPLLADAIAQGVSRSATFRRLIEAIDATDGLVYVLDGRCGQGVRACLHMSLGLSGGNRLLRIIV